MAFKDGTTSSQVGAANASFGLKVLLAGPVVVATKSAVLHDASDALPGENYLEMVSYVAVALRGTAASIVAIKMLVSLASVGNPVAIALLASPTTS